MIYIIKEIYLNIYVGAKVEGGACVVVRESFLRWREAACCRERERASERELFAFGPTALKASHASSLRPTH